MTTHQGIRDFIDELSGFAHTAEETLKSVAEDLEGNKGKLTVFSERMFTIRGTAQQLELPHIAKIAGLGEEIAIKGTQAPSRAHVRKCVGSLWDALTTVKYLLEHYAEPTSEEQEILINRLQATLKSLGGARPTMGEDEIAALIGKR
jgi:hypothetical protein